MKNSSSEVLYGMGAGEKLGPGDTWLRVCLVAAALKQKESRVVLGAEQQMIETREVLF
jgi:hypothetical protein